MLTAESLAHLERQALPCIDIDHGERGKSVPIDQLIGDKVKRPCVIRPRQRGPMSPGDDGVPSPSRPMPQRQVFFRIEPIDEMFARSPPFPVQQLANLPVAVPRLGSEPTR